MPRHIIQPLIAGAMLAAACAPSSAQQLVLDTSFGAGGTTAMTFPGGWWTDWNERNAHLINQGGAFSNSWVVAASHRTIIGGNLFYRRGWGYFSDSLTGGTVGRLASEAGPPITTGGIVQNGAEVTFIGTGAPTSALDVVDLRRTNVDPWASPSTSCAGGFQAVFSLGQSGSRDEVRGAAPRSNGNFLAVGTSRLSDGQSRGFVLSLNFDCTRNTGFGSNGHVILDVNPFVVGPPPRRVRVNTVATFTNGSGQERMVVGGGVRYGLDATSPGACFMAVYTPTGALDPTFDGDGIRLKVYVVGTAGPGRFGHDRVVVGRFSDGNRTVSVSTAGSSGTVSSSPAGIGNCGGPGGTCSAGFPPGTNLTLTAVPLPSNRCGNWGGGFSSCGTNPVCAFTVSIDVNGEAIFIPTTSVNIARAGLGGITSSPGGLVCGIAPGSGCSGTFDRDPGFGNQTTFTATPASGWRFVNWTGDFAACGNNPACGIVLSQPGFSATANFATLGENIFANGFDP